MSERERSVNSVDDTTKMVEQFCRDLNAAHDEILRLQGVPPEDYGKYDWPEWSGPANSIRWAEKITGKRLSKTSLSAPLCRCEPGVCLLHPSLTTCGMRERTSHSAEDGTR